MTFTPPHSLEAETAVLGACLLSPQACQTAVDTLTPEDFYRAAHGQVFSAVVEQYERGRVDTVTVTELLSDRGRLDEVGGPVAVHDLTDTTPSPGAVEHYARIVADKARRREGIEQARRFAASLSEADDVDESVDALVEQLTTRRGTSTVVDKDRVAGDFIRALGDGNLNPTFASGWSSLDRLWQLPQAALTTITGLPSSGKSTFLDVMLWRILQRNDDARVAYFSPEQGPSEDHLFELVTTWLGRTPQGTDGQRVDEAMRWWLDRIDWIDDVRDNTPSAVLSVARRMSPDILVVDPYNNLAPDLRNRGERQDLVIQDLLRRFRRFARDTGCAVVIVAHPRQTEQVAGTQNVFKVPTAAHISGGQEWWNHSDTILTVWRNQSGERPEEFGQPEDAQIVVQKVRRKAWGRQGRTTLRFDEHERRYADRPVMESVA